MSSFQRCCDPLKCHTRQRTRNARSDLRPVSNKLVETFPQLMLNPSQKICSLCRRKLYAMQNRTSSVLDLSGIVPQSSNENSNLADTSEVSHVDHDQFTANAEGRTDVELPDECRIDHIVHHSDGEDALGSGVAEESVDLMAQSENSPSVTDLNECVGAALYEVTDAISEDDSTDSSASSKVEDEFIQINEGLASFGVSPLSKRQMQRKGSSYGQKKIRKIVAALSEKLGVSDGDAESEIIVQLKEKFKATTNRSEKIQILTVLPNSWSLFKIMQEFGVSNYMARCAKKLVAEKGILSTPDLKHGRCLPAVTENLVKAFYHSDNINRVMPGRKDYVSVITSEGKREHCQKRLLLCNLKELYEQFKTLNPGLKVGFSTFAMLRPRECVLAGSSGAHSVCVCSLHQNAKLMFYASKITTLSEGAFSHYQHCLAAIMCNPPRIQCYLGKCKQCPGTDTLHLKLQDIMDTNMVDTVEYKQWTSTDRSTMECIVKPVDEFLQSFMKTLKTLKRHDLIAKQQSNFVTDAKEALGSNEFLVITDFSENYISKTETSSIRAVAREAGVDEKLVREWKGQEMELEEIMQKQGKMVCKVRKRIRGGGRKVHFPKQEKLIAERILQQRALHVRVLRRDVTRIAKEIITNPHFSVSPGWISKFMRRYRHGYHTAGSLPPWLLDAVLPPLSSATSSSSSAAPTPTTSSSRAAPTPTTSSRELPPPPAAAELPKRKRYRRGHRTTTTTQSSSSAPPTPAVAVPPPAAAAELPPPPPAVAAELPQRQEHCYLHQPHHRHKQY
ncbi:hypothetical protein EMCRGX_G014541 [Ephydatia muelleri]